MHGEESSSLYCCHLLNTTSRSTNSQCQDVSDQFQVSLHASFPQLLKGTEVLGLVVMMALELLGQRGELLL